MIGIMACVKKEERYIKEWIDYHTKIGVDRFFLADNNDNDYTPSLESVVYCYKNVTIIDCKNVYPVQPMCYNLILDKYGNDCDWFAMIDVDEFINVNDLKNFLFSFSESTDMVYLHCMNYGDNGLIYYENKPVQERFTTPFQKSPYIKTIFRKKNIIESHIHESFVITDQHCAMEHPFLIRKDCTGSVFLQTSVGYEIPYRESEFSIAYIKHYITKTIEEYIDKKFAKNGACSKNKYDIKYFFSYNKVTDEKTKLLKDKYGIIWNS